METGESWEQEFFYMSINDILRRYDTIELPRIGAKVMAVASTGVGELFLSYQN